MRTALGIIALVTLCATPLAAQTPTHFWTQGFGGVSGDVGNDVAVDPSGNVFITGSFLGTANFGGGPLTSAGSNDIYIAKYNSSGVHQWSKQLGGVSNDIGNSLATDNFGNVIVTGFFSGTVDFGGGPLTSAGNIDIFIVKYNSSGVHQWSKQIGSVNADNGLAVAVDVSSGVIVTGLFSGTVDFGGGPIVGAGNNDMFVVKYNSSGIHQWSKGFGSTGSDIGAAVAADGSGNVLVSGQFSLTVDFGGGPLTSAGNTDIVVAKFNSTGVHQWSKRFGSTGADTGNAVVADGSGNVILTGKFLGTVDFGGGPLVSASGEDIFLAKYNSGGAHQWSARFGGTGNDVGHALAVDGASNVYLTGNFSSTVDLGGGPFTTAGSNDIFLAKYNTSGTHKWSQRLGGTGVDDADGISVQPTGILFLAGSFAESVDFGNGPLVSIGSIDVLLAKYGIEIAEPTITAIADVGNDQGRRVRISFGHSGQDAADASPPVTRYEAFRRVDPLPVSSEGRTPLAAGWDFVGDVPAHRDGAYEILVPTLADSTVTAGMYRSVFYIRAATNLPQHYYESSADSGYSVDNLAPSAPSNFALAASVLTWKESKADDFDYFSVYGSASNVFDATAVLIDQTINTSLNVSASVHAYYFITATDFSGNEGRAARANAASDVGGPARYVLGVNAYPNPFNPATTIRYDVPSRGRVVVSVYDAKGERVATLVDEDRDAGSYPVRWDGTDARGTRVGSGVYFVRLQFGAETRSYKMTLLK